MTSSKNTNAGKHPGGRPRKFADPSKPVTMTLPERTLKLLGDVDTDRAKAVAKVTDMVMTNAWPDDQRVKLAKIDETTALIIVGPSASLKMIPWLKLVEITPTRYLLAVPSGTATEKLEVAISDLMEGLPANDEYERNLLEELRKQIMRLRRLNKMSKSEIILVETRNN